MRQPGLFDLDASGLKSIRELTARLEAAFRSYGYAQVEPPIMGGADALLENAGEETRRRAYVFEDPRGREMCLRPELTIPVCRLLLRGGMPKSGIARLSYSGPVFRAETHPGPGQYSQFHQAGVELVGHTDPVLAEAEIVALALDSAAAAGIKSPLMLFGDVRFFRILLDQLPLPERAKLQLKRNPAAIAELDTSTQASNSPSAEQMALAKSVAAIGPKHAVRLIQSFLSVAEINRIGTRSIEEIVERMTETANTRISDLPVDVARALQDFLHIEDAPRHALGRIGEFGRKIGVDFDPVLDEFERRLEIIEAYGIKTENFTVGTSVKRDLDYYSGFIFEMAHESGDQVSPLGGGGRYDRMIANLDRDTDLPAIGFALGVERLLLAAKRDFFDRPLKLDAPVHAHIFAFPPTPATAAAEAARALRKAGWQVSVDIRSPDSAPDDPSAFSHCRYLIAIDTDKTGQSMVKIRDMSNGQQRSVSLAELGAIAEKSL